MLKLKQAAKDSDQNAKQQLLLKRLKLIKYVILKVKQWRELQWKVLTKVYLNVKYDRVIINGVPAMNINTNLCEVWKSYIQ